MARAWRTHAALYLWVILGSGLGGAARYGGARLSAAVFGTAFPWGILIINVIGSFVIGFVFTYTGPDGRLLVSSTTRQFVMTGLCGGFTTFSSFSLDTLNLMRDGHGFAAAANIVLSVACCLLSVWCGHAIAEALSRPSRG
jgi:CrcB protein